MKLDKTDMRILTELDKDARITFSQLAKRIKVSRDVVQYRVGQLERKGIIGGYYALIDHAALGYLLVRLYVNFKNTTPEIEKEMIKYFADMPNSLTVYETEGQCDIACGIFVKSHKEFNNILEATMIKYRKYISHVQVNVMVELLHYLKNYLGGKDESFFNIGVSKIKGEDDVELLDLISSNARMPLAQIGQKLGMSINTTKYKLRRLEKDKIILCYRAKINHEKIGYEYYKVDLDLEDSSIINSLREFCRSHPNVTYEDRAFGGSDFEFDVEVESYDDFIKIINQLKMMFPEKIRNWKYYKAKKVHKLKYMVSLKDSFSL